MNCEEGSNETNRIEKNSCSGVDFLLIAAKYLDDTEIPSVDQEPLNSEQCTNRNQITSTCNNKRVNIEPSPSPLYQPSTSVAVSPGPATQSHNHPRHHRHHRRGKHHSTSNRLGTREVHNNLEKKRRAQLKECFEILKRQMPIGPDEKKCSNLFILGGATKYIQALRRKDLEYQHELERLVREKISAKQRLDALKKDLSTWDHIDFRTLLPNYQDEDTDRRPAPFNDESNQGNDNDGDGEQSEEEDCEKMLLNNHKKQSTVTGNTRYSTPSSSLSSSISPLQLHNKVPLVTPTTVVTDEYYPPHHIQLVYAGTTMSRSSTATTTGASSGASALASRQVMALTSNMPSSSKTLISVSRVISPDTRIVQSSAATNISPILIQSAAAGGLVSSNVPTHDVHHTSGLVVARSGGDQYLLPISTSSNLGAKNRNKFNKDVRSVKKSSVNTPQQVAEISEEVVDLEASGPSRNSETGQSLDHSYHSNYRGRRRKKK